MKKILLIEDDNDIAFLFGKKFAGLPYELHHLSSGHDAISYLSKTPQSPDAIILDMMLPGRTGYELLNTIKSIFPTVKLFIFSARADYADRIPKHLIEGFFYKADGFDKLLAALAEAFKA